MIFKILLIITGIVIVINIIAFIRRKNTLSKILLCIAALCILGNLYLSLESYKISKSIKFEITQNITEIVKLKFYDNQIIQNEISHYLKAKYVNNKTIDFSNVSFKIVDKIQRISKIENKKEVLIYFSGTIYGVSGVPIIIQLDDI